MRPRWSTRAVSLTVILAALQLAVSCGGDNDSADPTETALPASVSSTPTSPPATSPPALGRELLIDGSFELTPYEHWRPQLQQEQLIEITGEKVASGDRALHMTTPTSLKSWPWLILRNRFPAGAGDSLHVSYKAIETERGPVQVLIDFYNGNGEFIIRNLTSAHRDSGGEWYENSATFVAPEGSATALINIQLRIREQAPGETLEAWVDDVSVRQVLE